MSIELPPTDMQSLTHGFPFPDLGWRTVRRSRVRVMGVVFGSRHLSKYNGRTVRVAYAPSDLSRVRVMDDRARWICVAVAAPTAQEVRS